MRIAFTGAHGVGKTTAMNILYKSLRDKLGDVIRIETLGSSTRDLMDIGWERDYKGFELACIYERRKWMSELQGERVPWILSERCAIDETAYVHEKIRTVDYPMHQYDFYSVAKQEAEWEAKVYWDVIFYIPVDDRPVDNDSIRPTDKEYQRLIDNNILNIIDSYTKIDIVIKKMPVELKLWEDYFRKEVESWTK